MIRLTITAALISEIHQTSLHLETSTFGWSSPANSSGTRTTPARSSRLRRARSVTDVPFERSVISSPPRMPLARASLSESSASAAARWNCSSGARSTAGPEKSGR